MNDKNIIKDVMLSCAKNIFFATVFLFFAYLLVSLTTENRDIINEKLNLLYSNLVVYCEPLKNVLFSAYSKDVFMGLFIIWILILIWFVCVSFKLDNKNIQIPKFFFKLYIFILLSGSFIVFMNFYFIYFY